MYMLSVIYSGMKGEVNTPNLIFVPEVESELL